jgi:hypothetical protein
VLPVVVSSSLEHPLRAAAPHRANSSPTSGTMQRHSSWTATSKDVDVLTSRKGGSNRTGHEHKGHRSASFMKFWKRSGRGENSSDEEFPHILRQQFLESTAVQTGGKSSKKVPFSHGKQDVSLPDLAKTCGDEDEARHGHSFSSSSLASTIMSTNYDPSPPASKQANFFHAIAAKQRRRSSA